MARIRTVKPDLFRHEGLFELEQATGLPIRLAFIGLFGCCDREGRFKWSPRKLKLDVMPYDDVDFSRVLHALVTGGFVVRYEVEEKIYGCIPTFPNHQVINNRERPSELPPPEDGNPVDPVRDPDNPAPYGAIDTSATRDPRNNDADFDLHRISHKRNMEGKGREGNVYTTRQTDAALVEEVFEYWVSVMKKTNQTKLTPKRRKAIQARFKEGYDVETIKRAIDGCASSPHHMGQNDNGTVYDDLELICRTGEKIEQFSQNVAKYQPQRRTVLAGNDTETLEQFEERVRSQADRAGSMLDDIDD